MPSFLLPFSFKICTDLAFNVGLNCLSPLLAADDPELTLLLLLLLEILLDLDAMDALPIDDAPPYLADSAALFLPSY
jgi:hypothetical protein